MNMLRILVSSTACTRTLSAQAPIHSLVAPNRSYPENDLVLNVAVMFDRSFMDTILMGRLLIENTPSLPPRFSDSGCSAMNSGTMKVSFPQEFS